MLQLKEIRKSYQVNDFSQEVLKSVTLKFRENEFVAILGQSGSGKTTLLNIVGGLDCYDSGDLLISGKSTKKFKSIDWDIYRNKSIGFVFQNYNLISHISVIKNIEIGMSLRGVKAKERRKRALEVLDKVGLINHAFKKPNQLSGGQMQRVAIARALVTNPDIILADEPTGALDEKTGIQIMELISEIAKDKLVIMVTHNPELAQQYANRIIQLKDGEVIDDSNPLECSDVSEEKYVRKKISMSYFQALVLSINNIRTKLGRVFSISFAASIGIIGIAIILAFSSGFQAEIDKYEEDSLSQLPIVINTSPTIVSDDDQTITKEYETNNFVVIQDDDSDEIKHTNKITDEYMEYIKEIDSKLISAISLQYGFELNVVKKNENDQYEILDFLDWTSFPYQLDEKDNKLVKENYNVLAGAVNNNDPGLIIVVDKYGRIPKSAVKQLGVSDDEDVTIEFNEILEKELKVISNDDYYTQIDDYFKVNTDAEQMYKSNNSISLKIKAIIQGKKEKEGLTNEVGIYYTNALSNTVIDKNQNSLIVNSQKDKNYNVLTGESYADNNNGRKAKQQMMTSLGGQNTPASIQLYPYNYESKDSLAKYLDAYNKDKKSIDQIEYVDTGEAIIGLTRSIMSAITAILIAFSAISLVVSCIMITIITYISVLERTKEIGILRALGARKKDISRVFNAETIIIGFVAGTIGVGMAYVLTIPINMFVGAASQIDNIAYLEHSHALILIGLSVLLTLLSGYFPALSAANKDPVEALRSE